MKRLFFKRSESIQPVIVQQASPEKPMPSLAICILMDFLGYATFGIPILGEFLDLIWAPISGMIYFRMFGGAKGLFGGAFAFLEELLPGTDFIPTFTITWLLQYSRRKKKAYTIQAVSR
jgi:hypothetical protein